MEEINYTKTPVICPGTAKSGTTTFYDLIRNIKGLNVAEKKEIGFFAFNELYNKGSNWYFNNYINRYNNGVFIDISTQYCTYSKIAAKRIYETLGKNVKFIFFLRNPIDRAFSHYKMRKYNNLSDDIDWNTYIENLSLSKKRSFPDDIVYKLADNSIIRGKNIEENRLLYYIYGSNYAEIILDYLEFFAIENMYFVIFEEFVKNQWDELKKILDFIGVECNDNFKANIKSNVSGAIKYKIIHKIIKKTALVFRRLFGISMLNDKMTVMYYKYKNWNRKINTTREKITDKNRQKLLSYYLPDIEKLEQLIGADLSFWKK